VILYLLWRDFDLEGDELLGIFETSEERDRLKAFFMAQVSPRHRISEYEFKETTAEIGEIASYLDTHPMVEAWRRYREAFG